MITAMHQQAMLILSTLKNELFPIGGSFLLNDTTQT